MNISTKVVFTSEATHQRVFMTNYHHTIPGARKYHETAKGGEEGTERGGDARAFGERGRGVDGDE